MKDNAANIAPEIFYKLIRAVGEQAQVSAVGKTGGTGWMEEGGDVDVFVFCRSILPPDTRRRCAEPFGSFHTIPQRDPHWGWVDFIDLEGTEICLMYFTVEEMEEELRAVLAGERRDREGNCFYPTGRCASILSMSILLDKDGVLAGWQEGLAEYPLELSRRLTAHHLSRLGDGEDLERAVARRDPLFYHFALEQALDHFLQALFALNRCYFPSRKRTAVHLEAFAHKPRDCASRLLRMVELGARGDTLAESYAVCRELRGELAEIARGL